MNTKHLATTIMFLALAVVMPASTSALGSQKSIDSEVMGESRDYSVHLPASYNDDSFSKQSYPVFYVLDGHEDNTRITTALITQEVLSKLATEVIVVMIANTDRRRDMTPPAFDGGGADKFIGFIRDELMPQIDANYRTLGHRTIVGHSRGGTFAAYALMASPNTFQGYIFIDPHFTYDVDGILDQLAAHSESTAIDNAVVYVSVAGPDVGSEADRAIADAAIERFVSLLKSNAGSNLSVTSRDFVDENHASVFVPGLRFGYRSVFSDWAISTDLLEEDIGNLHAHFENLSAKWNIDLMPPPDAFVSDAAYQLLYEANKPDMALELFLQNVEDHPDSAAAHVGVGMTYMQMDRPDLAEEWLRKSLSIKPDHVWAEWVQSYLDRME